MSSDVIKYYGHTLLANTKKFFKELFAKGPDQLNIKIYEDIIVMQFSGILRKVELELWEWQHTDTITAYRTSLFELKKKGFIAMVEETVGREIVHLTFHLDIPDNSAVCLVILNKPL
ncbi:hypothetical protein Tfer_0621 [Thermincola ferriacetica]|uniref:Na+-translocating membrane potential-generating system MpsC domain-containing protein n=2 Tax=Thermincola TaxID=278993 RepID=D5XFM5_THEPJ|nr:MULTISPECIES: Na-translocating system protein MpsC family protein [Thermincola]ADG82446.1 hypothetical protein TherJR_1594 [Thermincola potens JR]KNZ70939.1 hypothetical protein Tfer_0621 [Thermincola ferriacetica]